MIIPGGIDLSGGPIPLAVPGGTGGRGACVSERRADCLGAGLQRVIVTLGGLSLYCALALIYPGGVSIFGLPDEFCTRTNGTLAGIPNPVVIVAMLELVTWVILYKTASGAYFMAQGGNPGAARIACSADQACGLYGFGVHGGDCVNDRHGAAGCGRTRNGHPVGVGRQRGQRHWRGQPDGRGAGRSPAR